MKCVGEKQKVRVMYRIALMSLAAAAVVMTMAPAQAKTKKAPRPAPQTYEQPYQSAPYRQSYGAEVNNNPNYRLYQGLGRCVEDLGYGRYEFCD